MGYKSVAIPYVLAVMERQTRPKPEGTSLFSHKEFSLPVYQGLQGRWRTHLFETIHPDKREELLNCDQATLVTDHLRGFYAEHYEPADYSRGRVGAVASLAIPAVIAEFSLALSLFFITMIYHLGQETLKPHCSNVDTQSDQELLCEGLRVLYAQKIRLTLTDLEGAWRRSVKPLAMMHRINHSDDIYTPPLQQLYRVRQALLAFDGDTAGTLHTLEHNKIKDPGFADHILKVCRKSWANIPLDNARSVLEGYHAAGSPALGSSGTGTRTSRL